MRRPIILALAAAIVLTTLAGLGLSQRSDSPARTILSASSSPSAVRFHASAEDWTSATTTSTLPPPPTTAPKRPTRATVSRSRTKTRPSVHTSGGGPCDRPSTCPQLRECENGGSYSHGTSPLYDGAYQFDHGSQWGMTPAQQDARADEMYAARGAQPWPKCGRFLK